MFCTQMVVINKMWEGVRKRSTGKGDEKGWDKVKNKGRRKGYREGEGEERGCGK